jgi:hypothetical protein
MRLPDAQSGRPHQTDFTFRFELNHSSQGAGSGRLTVGGTMCFARLRCHGSLAVLRWESS